MGHEQRENEVNDHNKLLELIKIKDFIEDHSLNDIREDYGIWIFKSISYKHKAFANSLFNEVELQFIPLYITNIIGEQLFQIKPKE